MPRNYVDNAMNRSLGRVGMDHGSMPVSRSSGSGGGGYSSSSTRTYVDNSSNRSLGRVGMAHGSMPVSRSSGSGGGGYSSSNTRTYVDNSSNRSLGRVGMAHGSMPVSRSSGSGAEGYSSSSTKTYVDNWSNRSLGRVGMSHGSMVVSRNDSGSHGSSSNSTNTYVDNSYNRKHGRVGMEHGSMVVSKGSNTPMSRGHQSLYDSGFCSPSVAPKGKVYKDNPLNRRLNRVGLPHGAAVHSLVQRSQKQQAVQPKTYVDNPFNRSVGRVGKPLGSMPISKRSKPTCNASNIYKQLKQNPECELDFSTMNMMGIDEEQQYEACDIAVSLLNRLEEVLKWQNESHTTDEPQTSEHVLTNFRGIVKIDFSEIELKQKIGSGGFSDVYFAKWKGTIVAAKVLRVQRVSKRRLKEFTDEIFVLCKLEHPNIVKFIGASVVTPNLCILIEYMQMSLFDALHMKDDVEFSEKEKITIIQHTAQGLQYLHNTYIAHCDMKSQNILLNYKPDDEILVVKITDFGLSMMKNNTDTSSSAGGEYVRNIGTPRYSSPENLRGELLNVKSLLMSDMYSYSLVVFEVICEDEPFYNLNYQQLKKQVGELHLLPEIPNDISINPSVFLLMKKCWDRDGSKRPTAEQFVDQALCIDNLYE